MQHAVPGTCQDCGQGGGGPVGGGAGGGGGVRHAGGQPRAGGRLTLASHHAGQRGGRGEGGGAGAGTGVLVCRGCRVLINTVMKYAYYLAYSIHRSIDIKIEELSCCCQSILFYSIMSVAPLPACKPWWKPWRQ